MSRQGLKFQVPSETLYTFLMSKKTIYFVRHGESEGNVSLYKAGIDPDLTDKGEEQAISVAERFLNIKVDIVIASPLIRAKKTGERIASKTGAPIVTDEMVSEWRIPEKMVGVLKSECPKMVDMIDDDFARNGVFPGGESFSELKERALLVMESLKMRSEDNILIASHDVFLHMFVSCIMLGEALTHAEFALLYERLKASNTGITILNFDSSQTTNPWTIVTWNDNTHI
jgi:broad specificity phosphatase PhoE